MGIDVRCDDDAVADAVAARFALLADDRTADADVVFDYVAAAYGCAERARGRPVYDPPDGVVLYDDEADVLAIDFPSRVRVRCAAAAATVSIAVDPSARDELWLLSRPMLTLPLIELLKRQGLYSVHAAGLALNRRAVVAAGATGSGKSTLCIALLRAGFEYLSDDLVLLRAEGNRLLVSGLGDELDVTPATAAFFPELTALSEAPPERGWPKHRVNVLERFGRELGAAASPAVLLFPVISPSGTTSVELLPARDALLALAPNVLLTDPAASQAHLDALGALVESSSLYRIEVGTDWDEVAATVAELVCR